MKHVHLHGAFDQGGSLISTSIQAKIVAGAAVEQGAVAKAAAGKKAIGSLIDADLD